MRIGINQQPHFEFCDFEISKYLGLKNRIDFFYALQFYNNGLGLDEIDPVFFHSLAAILNRAWPLTFEWNASEFKLGSERGLVNILQQSGTELAMNFNRTPYDPPS